MIWNFVIIAILWATAEFSWGVDYTVIYEALIEYLEGHDILMSGYLAGGAFGLVGLAYIFRALGWYSLVFLVSKASFYVSQFAVCLFSYAAIALWFYVSRNLWADVGYLVAAVPFLWLFSSSVSLWIFDFNYPVAERIYNNILLAIISIVVVLALSFFGLTF
jgi:hypothetical protein